MDRLTSADGTSIVFERQGEGPAVILVGGGLDDGAETAPLATLLAAKGFTAYNYARRGRAGSGDTLPYAVEREVEDIAALIDHAGGRAHLWGVSSGGALALEAAAAGIAVAKTAVYEVPYLIDSGIRAMWRQYTADLDEALALDDRDRALELFMRLAGSSEDDIAGARASDYWPGLLKLAPTLAYDARCLRDGLPPESLAKIGTPVLVLTGGAVEMFEQAGDALAVLLPQAERVTLEGQGHVVDPGTAAAQLARFYRE